MWTNSIIVPGGKWSPASDSFLPSIIITNVPAEGMEGCWRLSQLPLGDLCEAAMLTSQPLFNPG